MKTILFKSVESPYLVSFNGEFRVKRAATEPPEGAPSKKEADALRADIRGELDEMQRRLYADDRFSLLLIFQAMDAAGKDGTIRAVMNGVDPTGCQVYSFKQPSAKELDHDFLWRVYQALPERGRIGIFNRSHYEEVIVVRVHPEYLATQKLPYPVEPQQLWEERYESIRNFEQHLARNGTVILKFWLNVSRAEQRRRFIERINEPEKNWKFSPRDIEESRLWKPYMQAYEDALNATSRPWAPWYSIPADDKNYMRLVITEIIVGTLKRMKLEYPALPESDRFKMEELRHELEAAQR